jgi:hypothetical protein
MGKVVRGFCCAVIVLVVGLVWLYLPSFAFSRPIAKRSPAGAAAGAGAARASCPHALCLRGSARAPGRLGRF